MHQALLSIIKPRIILCNGNGKSGSAYHFLSETLPQLSTQQVLATAYSSASIKTFETVWDDKVVLVIGIPHLSRFYPQPYMVAIKKLIMNQ